MRERLAIGTRRFETFCVRAFVRSETPRGCSFPRRVHFFFFLEETLLAASSERESRARLHRERERERESSTWFVHRQRCLRLWRAQAAVCGQRRSSTWRVRRAVRASSSLSARLCRRGALAARWAAQRGAPPPEWGAVRAVPAARHRARRRERRWRDWSLCACGRAGDAARGSAARWPTATATSPMMPRPAPCATDRARYRLTSMRRPFPRFVLATP